MLLIQVWEYAESIADRTGDRSKRIANFVGDGSRQTAHRRQPVLHANFALQAANFRQIVKSVDKAELRHVPALATRATVTRKVLRKLLGAIETNFAMRMSATRRVGSGIYETAGRWTAPAARYPTAFQQLLGGRVHQSDASIQTGGDQTAADGLNDVFMQGLQDSRVRR